MYYLGSSVTAVVLGVIYGITNTFQPLPDDVFRYGGFLRWICKMMLSNDYDGILLDLKEPFDLRDGWLLWAGVGLLGALIAIALIGFALNIFSGENPHREVRYCLWSFKKRDKKRENLESVLLFVLTIRRLRAISSPRTGRRNISLCREKERGDLANTDLCDYKRSHIRNCSSHSWRISTAVCARFKDTTSGNFYKHLEAFLEYWEYVATLFI
ncbi:hypothetical protein BHE74_00013001, partial [Ensete ventricosum]